MKKTLVEFGKISDIEIAEEQLTEIKGGRRRRIWDDEPDGDPGCPPDYDD